MPGRMGFHRLLHASLAGILALALAQPALAGTTGKLGGPMVGPNGKPIVTEAQAQQQHDERLRQVTAQVRTANAQAWSGGIGTQRYADIRDGSTMVTSLRYDSDTGFIADEKVMGTLGRIRAVTLKVLGMVFETAGTVVDNITFFFGLIADDQMGAEVPAGLTPSLKTTVRASFSAKVPVATFTTTAGSRRTLTAPTRGSGRTALKPGTGALTGWAFKRARGLERSGVRCGFGKYCCGREPPWGSRSSG